MRKIIAALFIMLLIACGGQPTNSIVVPDTVPYTTIYHDDKNNVTCYIYSAYQQGGISCIPDDQLDKDK